MDYYLDKRSEEVLQLLLYANHYITVNEIATHLNRRDTTQRSA